MRYLMFCVAGFVLWCWLANILFPDDEFDDRKFWRNAAFAACFVIYLFALSMYGGSAEPCARPCCNEAIPTPGE